MGKAPENTELGFKLALVNLRFDDDRVKKRALN